MSHAKSATPARAPQLGYFGWAFVGFVTMGLYLKYLKVLDLSPHLFFIPFFIVAFLLFPRNSLYPHPVASSLASNATLLTFGAFCSVQYYIIGTPAYLQTSQNMLMVSFALCGFVVTCLPLLFGRNATKLLEFVAFAIYTVGFVSAVALLLQIFVSFTLFDLAGWTQKFGLSDLSITNEFLNNVVASRARGRGLSESVHVFAASVSVALVMGLYFYRTSQFVRWTIPVVIVALLFNKSLTALLALTLSLVAWRTLVGRKWSIARVGLLFAFVAGMFFALVAIQSVFAQGAYDLLRSGGTGTVTSRLASWDRGLEMFLTHPLMGIGGGGFKGNTMFYHGVFIPQASYLRQEAHSIVVQVLSQWGLLGFCLLGWYFLNALRIATRLSHPLGRTFGIALTAMLLKALAGNEILLFQPYFLASAILAMGIIERAARLPQPSLEALDGPAMPSSGPRARQIEAA